MSDAINIVTKSANLQATPTKNESSAADAKEGASTATTKMTTKTNFLGGGEELTMNEPKITPINNANAAQLTTTNEINSECINYGPEQSGTLTLRLADVSSVMEANNSSSNNKIDITIETSQPSAKISTVVVPTTIAASANCVDNLERSCWICFATEEDNRMAAWVQPCKCRGTTKWVHQSCLYRWIDEKQKGNALRTVCCQQCQTEYIIVFPQIGKIANVLESFDNLIKRLSPFLAAGIFVGSLYWTAVTYGAVTFLQVVGHKKGLSLMENGDPLILLLGLPAIPVGLVLGRMIRWEDAVIRLIRNRRTVARKFPLMNFIIPYPDEEEEPSAQHPATPTLSDPVSATRIFCGALLLPTISSIVGRLLFESIDNTLHRTLLGGLTFITVKGILKIYLKQQQYTRKKKRRIIDYNEENLRNFLNRNANASRYFVAPAATPRQPQPEAQQQQQQQQQAQQVLDRDFIV